MAHFIGKTISLISNSDIRYVGVLHEINSKESTVSLRNVRSYGTEGRRGGINEFPASDNIYEFIVFRGSDVKDLSISDPNSAPALVDPAITAQQPQRPPQQQQQPPQAQQPPPQSFAAQGAYAASSWNARTPVPQQPPTTASFGGGSLTSSTPTLAPSSGPLATTSGPADKTSSFSFAQAPISSRSPAPQGTSFTPPPSLTAASSASIPAQAPAPTPAAAPAESKPQPAEEQSAKKSEVPEPVQAPKSEPTPPAQPESTQPPTQPQYNNRQSYGQPSQNRRGPAGGPVPAQSSGEFNFAEMNARFSKDEIAKEVAANDNTSVIPVDAQSSFYDRKTSFFDNISSTTKERIEGVEEPRRRGDERRLNLETFGQEYVHRNNRGGFRGGRGGGRGGGYRGNRNNNGYNNNNNNNNNNNYRGNGQGGGYYNNNTSNNGGGNNGGYYNNNHRRNNYSNSTGQPQNNFGPAPE